MFAAPGKAGEVRRLAEAGGHLAAPKVHRRLVCFHDVPEDTTPDQKKAHIDRKLERAGLDWRSLGRRKSRSTQMDG